MIQGHSPFSEYFVFPVFFCLLSCRSLCLFMQWSPAPFNLVFQFFVEFFVDLNGGRDVDGRLQAVFTFHWKLFFRPWLWEALCAAELISKVGKLERALVEELVSSTHASAPAQLHAQAHSSAHTGLHWIPAITNGQLLDLQGASAVTCGLWRASTIAYALQLDLQRVSTITADPQMTSAVTVGHLISHCPSPWPHGLSLNWLLPSSSPPPPFSLCFFSWVLLFFALWSFWKLPLKGGYCHSAAVVACLCFLCSAFLSSFLPHFAPSLCVCLWAWQQQQQQQSGTPERDQLITHWLYLSGLSTTSVLDYASRMVTSECYHLVFSILWVFCVSCVFCPLSCLSLCLVMQWSPAPFNFVSLLPTHLSSSTLALVNSVCLPAKP